MAFTFKGKVAEVGDLEQLARVTENIAIWNRIKRCDVVIAKASEIMTQDIDQIIAFIRSCKHNILIYAILRLYIVRYGAKDFANADAIVSLINVVRNFSQEGAAQLIDLLFAQTPQFFVVPDNADTSVLTDLLRNVSQLITKIDNFDLLRDGVIRECDLFASDIVTYMAQAIVKGHPVKTFFESTMVVNYECDLIVAVALTENVRVAVLMELLASDVFTDPRKRTINFIRSTVHFFIESLIVAARREKTIFTLHELCVIAQNIIDVKNDGKSSMVEEMFVITAALPLFCKENDVITLSKAFGTASGRHALICSFLSACTSLTNYQLKMLAELVGTTKYGGKEAMDQLRIAKEKFGLTADIEKDLDFANNRFPLMTGLFIEIRDV